MSRIGGGGEKKRGDCVEPSMVRERVFFLL